MTINRKIRGIRDSIPPGYVLGRASGGNGPPQLIKISDIAQLATSQGGGGSLSAQIDQMAGSTLNDVLTRTSAGWRAAAPATGSFMPFNPSVPTAPLTSGFTKTDGASITTTMNQLASGRGIT